jgi:hypothetical protein
MHRLRYIAAVLFLAALWPLHSASQVKKWIEPDGKITYSDVRPSATARDANASVSPGFWKPSRPGEAGIVEAKTGSAILERPKGPRGGIQVGTIVSVGDVVATADNGEVHIKMADGGVLAVRPHSTVKLTDYQSSGTDDDRSVIQLLRGSLRSITGLIGRKHPENYRIVAASATIGVRGTDHETTMLPEGAKNGSPGVYERVYSGRSTISTGIGAVIEVQQGRAGYADHKGSAPTILDSVPAFLNTPSELDSRLQGRDAEIQRALASGSLSRSPAAMAGHIQRVQQGLKSAADAAAARNATIDKVK